MVRGLPFANVVEKPLLLFERLAIRKSSRRLSFAGWPCCQNAAHPAYTLDMDTGVEEQVAGLSYEMWRDEYERRVNASHDARMLYPRATADEILRAQQAVDEWRERYPAFASRYDWNDDDAEEYLKRAG
jgi:hypothetical protein